MRKFILLEITLSLMSITTEAQNLVFNYDSTLKIVQFTDMHYEYGNPK